MLQAHLSKALNGKPADDEQDDEIEPIAFVTDDTQILKSVTDKVRALDIIDVAAHSPVAVVLSI